MTRLLRSIAALLVVLAVPACGGSPAVQRGAGPASDARPTSAHAVPPGWRYSADAPAVTADHGMVVTDASLATRVGVDVLQKGGNAVDAAVATAFALAVVLPSAGNLGGGGFMVAHVTGHDWALDFRETAPGAASRDMFLDAHGNPTDKSVTGHLAAGIPGSVAGLWAAHEKLGTQPWAELLQPAIRLAEGGFPADADTVRALTDDAARLATFPASAALFLPGGKPPVEGTTLRNPDLARTLRVIAAKGSDGFYKGETAERLVAEMQRGGGIVTARDLEGYAPKWREPLVFSYRGRQIVSMPPPSSGGIAIALIAHQLEPFRLGELGWHSAPALHLQAEAMRRAFAVRNQLLGDPDFIDVPTATLLSPAYAAGLQASITTGRATPSKDIAVPVGAAPDGRHTTHFSVADRLGNVVALTTTLNGNHGSAVTVSGAGFLLNNEMDDFTSKPGSPNQFGLIMGEANAVAPGKRMLSSMAPTIVLDERAQPLLVTGASGGPLIITTVFQLISNRLDYGLDVGASMRAPRFHHQHLPDQIGFEAGGLDEPTIRALAGLGHQVVPFRDFWVDGWTVAATIERRDGRWTGAADPRLHGSAAGY